MRTSCVTMSCNSELRHVFLSLYIKLGQFEYFKCLSIIILTSKDYDLRRINFKYFENLLPIGQREKILVLSSPECY